MGNQFTTNPELDENENDERNKKSSCWKSFLKKRRTTIDFGFFAVDDYDYVVEKLAIKYIRVSMFATTFDNDEYSRNNHQSQNTSTVLTASVQVSPTLPTNLPKSELLSKTPRKLRFSKQDGSGVGNRSDTVKKPSLAHSIGGTSPAAELMSSLTAFHPDLKESERPAKDPYSLNITKSQRSFAEELSEAAARKNNNQSTDLNTISGSISSSIAGTSKQL
ncbi:hypothetical protein PV327_005463 [Microctonus hyperodae]|uniref:Uncharacterized protein n=1 Tax=Microctonus hyperodae TaxID=165561 RepID=A0AA39KZV2_MICHY|nr:hypothetical protein PV327_005463 [Microctonus hyperodae]